MLLQWALVMVRMPSRFRKTDPILVIMPKMRIPWKFGRILWPLEALVSKSPSTSMRSCTFNRSCTRRRRTLSEKHALKYYSHQRSQLTISRIRIVATPDVSEYLNTAHWVSCPFAVLVSFWLVFAFGELGLPRVEKMGYFEFDEM